MARHILLAVLLATVTARASEKLVFRAALLADRLVAGIDLPDSVVGAPIIQGAPMAPLRSAPSAGEE